MLVSKNKTSSYKFYLEGLTKSSINYLNRAHNFLKIHCKKPLLFGVERKFGKKCFKFS